MGNHNKLIFSEEISTSAKDKIADFLEDLKIFLTRSEDGIGPYFYNEGEDLFKEHSDGETYFQYYPMESNILELENEEELITASNQKFYLDEQELNETFTLIDFAKESLLSGQYDDLIEAIEPLLEIGCNSGLIYQSESNDILEWAATIEKKEFELLYEPLDYNIIIPSLIIEANDALIGLISKYPDLLYKISPRKFEEIIAEIFDSLGYHIELTARTRDGGRDILAIQKNVDFFVKLIIECKRFGRDKKVGLSFVQRLLGVKIAERANKALLVTTAFFTTPAKKFESEHFWDLELKDYTTVLNWVNAYTGRKRGIATK